MEPRPFRRGDRCTRGGIGRRSRRFNGATPFQAWRHLLLSSRHVPPGSFNGATPFQAWRPRFKNVPSGKTSWLQWSHALSGVETSRQIAAMLGYAQLQWSHALSGVETDGAGVGHRG